MSPDSKSTLDLLLVCDGFSLSRLYLDLPSGMNAKLVHMNMRYACHCSLPMIVGVIMTMTKFFRKSASEAFTFI